MQVDGWRLTEVEETVSEGSPPDVAGKTGAANPLWGGLLGEAHEAVAGRTGSALRPSCAI